MTSHDPVRGAFLDAQATLAAFLADPNCLEGVNRFVEAAARTLHSGGLLMSCGNGGSMCDAMHFAEELTGRYRDDRPPIAALSISDPSHLTCVGNDHGFEQVFARFVQAHGREGDVLLAISTSGNSPNVLRAAEAAKAAGMRVVGLTGKDGGRLAPLCDVEVRVPHNGYADRVQEVHIKVIHALIDHNEHQV